MLIKFDFSSKTVILIVKFAFATVNLKIETLRMRRRFACVFSEAQENSEMTYPTKPVIDVETRHPRDSP